MVVFGFLEYLFLFYVYEYLHVSKCPLCMSGVRVGQKRALDPLELELKTVVVVSCHVGVAHQRVSPYGQPVLLPTEPSPWPLWTLHYNSISSFDYLQLLLSLTW